MTLLIRAAMPTAIAKLAPPRLPRGTVARERLYRLLDEQVEANGCAWIAAGPGCGKTVLATAWARARARRLFWFTADEGDASAGNFLHFLAQLIATRREPLCYVPDGRVPLALVVRAFVREFYRRLPHGALLVIDEAERIPGASEGAQVLEALVQEAPASVHLLVLSRLAPDAALARAQISDRLAVVGWDELRLTSEETGSLAAARNPALGPVEAGSIHARSDGWAAGVRLLAETLPPQVAPDHAPSEPEALFSYIASELFETWPGETRQVLLAVAGLPSVSADVAAVLSSNPRAGAILAQWSRRQFFLARIPGPSGTHYRLHPLLREFLLARAAEDVPLNERVAGLQRAARALAAAGDIQGAAGVWIDLQNWPRLTQLMEDAGDRLLREGRHGELLRWLDVLPAGHEARDPLLGLWRARALLATAPAQGVDLLAQLWPQLERAAPLARLADAWDAVVCSHLFLRRPQRMADWHEVAVRLMERVTSHADAVLRRQVLAASFVGFSKIDPQRWAEGEQAAIDRATDPATPADLRMMFGASLHFHSQWRAGARPLPPSFAAEMRALVRRGEGSVHQRLVWCWIDALMQVWFDPDESLRSVRETVALATALQDEHGIREFGFVHFVPMMIAAHQGRPEAASAHAAALRALPPPPDHALFEVVPRLMQLAMYDLAQGNTEAAARAVREVVTVADAVGSPPQRMVARCVKARSDAARGDLAAAYRQLRAAASIGRRHEVGAWRCGHWLTASALALDAGRVGAAVVFARRGFGVMARHGVLRPAQTVQDRAELSRLCALAWRHGIERDWVRTLVRVRGLEAPPGTGPAGWPWPVRITSLGALRIERDGQPLVFGRKAPRKVLELLRVLAQAAPRRVPAPQLVDELWPDEEGDAGHRAFLSAVHRLRKLVGERSVVHMEGRVGLDARHVHVESGAVRDPPAEPGRARPRARGNPLLIRDAA
jgi:ATP/maltotriose-dependent transcriptional regulator MalT